MENWKLITDMKDFRGHSFITFTAVNASSILSPLTCFSIIRLNTFCIEEFWFKCYQKEKKHLEEDFPAHFFYSSASLNSPELLIKLT